MAEKTNIPTNKIVRKPTPKKKFSLDNFKKKTGSVDVPSKPNQWLPISKGLEQATGLPGFPKGYVTLFRGYSNTGKSTALFRSIVAAQKDGSLPIIIDLENNIDVGNSRLTLMGFDWDGDYILISNDYILEKFGKPSDKERNEASIEDLAKCIYYFIDQQKSGNLPYDIQFAIDSIGTLNCNKTINALEKNTSDNNQWNAGAYEKTFMSLFNNVIPNSRKVTSEYFITVTAVQKIWYDGMNKKIQHKGGTWSWFTSRLIYHFGGILTQGIRRVIATSKKRDLQYGTENKVNIEKNHIDGEWGGISLEGKIISTPHGFVFGDKDSENAYKKEHILYFRNRFNDDTLSVEDIEFKKVKTEDTIIDKSFEESVIDKGNTDFDNQTE